MSRVRTPGPRLVLPPKSRLDYLAGASTDLIAIPQPDNLIPTEGMSQPTPPSYEQYPVCPLGGTPQTPGVGFIDGFSRTWYSSQKTGSIVLVSQWFLFYIIWLGVPSLLFLLVRLGFGIWGCWKMYGKEVDMGEGSSLAGREVPRLRLPESGGESEDENTENGVFKNSTGDVTEVGSGSGLEEEEGTRTDRVEREVGCGEVKEKEEAGLGEVCGEGAEEMREEEEHEEEMVEAGEKQGGNGEEPDRGNIRGTGAGEEGGMRMRRGMGTGEEVRENVRGERTGNKEGAGNKSDENREEGENGGGENGEGKNWEGKNREGEETGRSEEKDGRSEEKDGDMGKDGNREGARIKRDGNGGEEDLEEGGARKSDEVPVTEGTLGEYGDNVKSKENTEEAITMAKGILGVKVGGGVEEGEEDEGGVVLPIEQYMLTK
ncbi:unnamed protein product [Tuber aestivum]|uniref:Uncharacterized protein n=1 Tax=Tuber aestivum TaxID=59557 RepID=A0A292PW46_9PEZI|nr:unnamed protein product [Tuber aestivum]